MSSERIIRIPSVRLRPWSCKCPRCHRRWYFEMREWDGITECPECLPFNGPVASQEAQQPE